MYEPCNKHGEICSFLPPERALIENVAGAGDQPARARAEGHRGGGGGYV